MVNNHSLNQQNKPLTIIMTDSIIKKQYFEIIGSEKSNKTLYNGEFDPGSG